MKVNSITRPTDGSHALCVTLENSGDIFQMPHCFEGVFGSNVAVCSLSFDGKSDMLTCVPLTPGADRCFCCGRFALDDNGVRVQNLTDVVQYVSAETINHNAAIAISTALALGIKIKLATLFPC